MPMNRLKCLKVLSLTALTASFAMSSQALAQTREGGTSGGGGAALVCFTQANIVSEVQASDGMVSDDFIPYIKSIETYDLIKARSTREPGVKNPQPFPAIEGEGPDSYIKRLAERFEKTPGIRDLILNARDWYLSATREGSLQPVVQVRDAGETIGWDPRYCTLTTTIQQNFRAGRLVLTEDERLLDPKINSELSRDILYLHEGLFAIARAIALSRGIDNNKITSDNVRDFIATIAQVEVPVTGEVLLERAYRLGLFAERWKAPPDTHSPAVFRAEKENMEKLAWKWGGEYNTAHPRHMRLARLILAGQRARWVSDVFDGVGLIDIAIDLTRGEGRCVHGHGNAAKRCTDDILNRRHSDWNVEARTYIKNRLRSHWYARRMELAKDPALDPRVIEKLNAFVGENVKCRLWYSGEASCEIDNRYDYRSY